MTTQHPLWTGFRQAAQRFPERPALMVEGRTTSYRDLWVSASRIAATIQSRPQYTGPALTAVFAQRSRTAFAGVLGALLAGHGYVPLNRLFPIERTLAMLHRSGARVLVVDTASRPLLSPLLSSSSDALLVLVPDTEDLAGLRNDFPRHDFIGRDDLGTSPDWSEPPTNPQAVAYLLFTSGSTGPPKGVAVAHRNVTAFVDYMAERYQVSEHDRFSQMFDLTFDLSAFDMFVCWERGALLCCPPQKTLINPGRFIQEQSLSVWFCVPSTAAFMSQLGMLKPGRYPSLRVSLFCGEPLPTTSALAWSLAAPNSILENLYGPTELTIACTLYRWDPLRCPREADLGIVPIGYAYPNMHVLVASETLVEVGPGEEGELLMSGPQMSLGYWKDPERTAAAFVVPPGKREVYYRTGDRVRRPTGNGPLTHLGRLDLQIKVNGHRVELGEIEARVRDATGRLGVVAVGWPTTPSGYGGIEVFVEGTASDPGALRDEVARHLPEYMVPRRFHFIERLPRNANGKYDRCAMMKLLGGVDAHCERPRRSDLPRSPHCQDAGGAGPNCAS